MFKTLKLTAAASALALLSACNLNTVIQTDAQNAQKEKTPAPIYTPERQNTSSDDKTQSSAVKKDSAKSKKGVKEQLSIDDSGNVVSTVIDDRDDISSATDNNAMPERPEGVAGDLPDYASGSSYASASCDIALNVRSKEAARKLANTLASRVNVAPGEIYIAPTVIPDKYLDCISDVSSVVSEGMKISPSFKVAQSQSSINISSQNIGSSRLIPLLVRECREKAIPYLAISIVRDFGTTPTLTLRLIRVDTGITLSQAYEKLK